MITEINIRDFILASCKATNTVGYGNEAIVYNLNGLGFDDVVMRVIDSWDARLQAMPKKLLSSTFLTPVDYGYQGHLFGPSLMQGEGISFHVRQPGRSLGFLFGDKKKELGSPWKAQQEISTTLLNLPLSEYERLLGDMNFLTAIGRSIEPTGDNLMLSKTTLRWVDIGKRPEFNHLGNVIAMLSAPENGGTGRLVSKVEDNLYQAAENTQTPLNINEITMVLKTLRRQSQYGWKRPQPIHEIGELPFSASQAKLRSKLTLARNYLGYPL